MNIFNHIIKDEEIIGVGTLNWQQKGTNIQYVNYSFQLFTRQNTITISSEVFECFGTIDAADCEKLTQFKTEYWIQRQRICKLLGVPDEMSSIVTDELRNSCEVLYQEYRHLFTDLQFMIKTEKSKKLIHGRMKSIQDSIENLKTLASA